MTSIFCTGVPTEEEDGTECVGDYYKDRINELETLYSLDPTGEQTINTKKKKSEKLPYITTNFGDLRIKPVETNKNSIKQREMMKNNIIPVFPSVSVLCGMIKSGKSTLAHNFLTRPEFYGISYEGVEDGKKPKHYFDTIFLFAGSNDDMYDQLIEEKIIKKQHVKFNPQPSDIQRVIDTQTKGIERDGLLKSPKVLIILEDLVADKKLMNSTPMRELFIHPRQMNISVFVLSQYLRYVPAGLRAQAMNLFLFEGDRRSTEIICDEFCPAMLKHGDFMKLIEQAQEKREGDSHSFLHINKCVGVSERYRRNLDKIISL